MSDRAIIITGDDVDLPAVNEAGILVGLPGGDRYLTRAVEQGLIAERRLHDLAIVRAIELGEFIRDRDARRYGLPRIRPNIERAKDQLRRERARASGLEVPDRLSGESLARQTLDLLRPPKRTALENARAALRSLKRGPA